MGFPNIGPIGPSVYPNNVSINRSLEAVRKFASGAATAHVMGDKMGESGGTYYESPFGKENKNKPEEPIGEELSLEA